ncbi:MAG: 5-(carboxyamino)imidazole ribonucleotide synthase [Candidatus Izimaplasma sp.]|nr:5-(carboxyamino)imidazole ribonucleotide synthase [Candidatus Izimaplasma bacterium]
MNIGIIGGGQLGLMMAQAAKLLHHKIISLDPNPRCPLASFSDLHITASYNDLEKIEYLVSKSDVITYEFENVDLDLISKFEKLIPQGRRALEISKNRLLEKEMAEKLGIKTAKFHKLSDENIEFYPCIIKTTTGGYDGKGQFVISNKEDLKSADFDINKEYIVEEYISFDYESSVIITRDSFGRIECFPTPINNHKNNILNTSLVTKDFPMIVKKKMEEYSKKIIENLDYIGTMAIEYFITNEDVIFNELAPRPHNSGHYSIEGCSVSQFENHILAITNEVIKKPVLLNNTLMLNILGQDNTYIENAKKTNNIYLHMYGKDEFITNRKMGHITFLRNDLEDINQTLIHITKE